MPDDLETLVAEALPCRHNAFYANRGAKAYRPCEANATDDQCERCISGPAVREALKKAERKGAREMREKLADKMAGWAHHELGDGAIEEAYLIAMKQPLPHPEQESD